MHYTKEKVKLIKQAQERFPEEIIKPCGTKPALWDCFEIFDNKLTFWYNIDRNTHMEALLIERGVIN